ncbi:hypothetical protein RND81_05G174000 [Saponaria officinalis]|uniref:BHLH domain-containing protein n=1 Tax=Saponaria officinalis TaxID=3572 RepID=A0AAW1KXR9_SAPOF
MEKEQICSNYGLMSEMSTQEEEELTNSYFNTNWCNNNSNDQNDPFESTLTSMVSSPTTTTTLPSSGDRVMMTELIGRLGSICDSSGQIIGNNYNNNNSCYNTPLNSPPLSKINVGYNHGLISGNHSANLGNFNDDPGFVERAAKFSCFNHNININNVNRSASKLENGKLSRVNSEKKMINNNINNNGGISIKNCENNGESRESSSVSEQIIKQNDGNSRKRKSISKANKLKDSTLCPSNKIDKVENEESDAKRSKLDNELNKEKNTGDCNNSKEKQNNNNKNNNNNNDSKAEPPKDYIHVRARRGQATDSHSLAERVRREKISERMKFLQDLVPGCNKVTGKATVLDEIINYVQSLQRQVEFLSMKLSTVNPRAEFNMDALLSKDMFQSRGSQLSQTMYQLLDQNSAQEFPFAYQSTPQMPLPFPNGAPNGFENPFSVGPVNVVDIRRNPNVPLPSINGFADSLAQLPTLWEDDLQSIVQMGNVPNLTQSVHGTLPNAHMKVEL